MNAEETLRLNNRQLSKDISFHCHTACLRQTSGRPIHGKTGNTGVNLGQWKSSLVFFFGICLDLEKTLSVTLLKPYTELARLPSHPSYVSCVQLKSKCCFCLL